ncbi:NAD(P)-dependent oxidoreductase [Vagococcus elongatus]|uniref:NADH-flavin reductase n=1 Tax=Vagococcus elongatus TaxID=180344 RepID=A0A430AQA9_9ENTE|nr:NAD(P)H-binding protein [Vagococcus elongatus]RSU10163.1 NADH-flavin reductase [Vagococcus elongatus]
MKIGIIGATGKQGNLILQEALNRGHEVLACVRNKDKLTQEVPYIEKELYDLTTEEIEPLDVVVNAFNAPPNMPQLHQSSLRHITKILKQTPVRLYVVGGAGSLYTDDSKTTMLFEQEGFPKSFHLTAENMAKSLKELENSTGTTWTYVSPAAHFDFNGPKTGQYKIGGEVISYDENGKSYLSYQDYASAMLDIIESGNYKNERISVYS